MGTRVARKMESNQTRRNQISHLSRPITITITGYRHADLAPSAAAVNNAIVFLQSQRYLSRAGFTASFCYCQLTPQHNAPQICLDSTWTWSNCRTQICCRHGDALTKLGRIPPWLFNDETYQLHARQPGIYKRNEHAAPSTDKETTTEQTCYKGTCDTNARKIWIAKDNRTAAPATSDSPSSDVVQMWCKLVHILHPMA